MNDLADLIGVKGIRDPSLRWNAVTGDGWRLETLNSETGERDFLLQPEKNWIVDMLTRRRGVGKTGDGIFIMHLTPVGSPPPVVTDDDLKPAVGMTAWAPDTGCVEITTCGAVLRTAIVALWEKYKGFTEASKGLVPVVKFGPAIEVPIGKKNNIRTFWAPTFLFVHWLNRNEVPGLCYRPATVLPPKPSHLQIQHLSAKLKAHLKKATTSEAIDDEILQ
jgi:hypothetical protein